MRCGVCHAPLAVRGHRMVEASSAAIQGHLTLKDARDNQRRFGSRGAAFRAAQKYIVEHNQRELDLCPCAASMGCLCVCHAAGLDASEPCDTSEERARRIAAGTEP